MWQAGVGAVSKKNISPYGCKDCVHVWVDRCGLTGHKIQWHVNAKHHCIEFQKERRNENRDGDIRNVARESDMGRDSGLDSAA